MLERVNMDNWKKSTRRSVFLFGLEERKKQIKLVGNTTAIATRRLQETPMGGIYVKGGSKSVH